jgi:hypothetical protein
MLKRWHTLFKAFSQFTPKHKQSINNISRKDARAYFITDNEAKHNCGNMEKVWEELKRIEAQAEEIRSQAQLNAKEIINLSQKQADQLLENSKTYANQEAKVHFDNTINQANLNREQKLKSNQEKTKKLTQQAEEKIEQAASLIMKAVLEEKPT